MADEGFRFGPTTLTGSSAILYTVPALKRAHVLWYRITNPTAATVDVNLGAAGDADCLHAGFPVPASGDEGAVDWTGFLVLEAGETLVGDGSGLVVTGSGVEVDA